MISVWQMTDVQNVSLHKQLDGQRENMATMRLRAVRSHTPDAPTAI